MEGATEGDFEKIDNVNVANEVDFQTDYILSLANEENKVGLSNSDYTIEEVGHLEVLVTFHDESITPWTLQFQQRSGGYYFESLAHAHDNDKASITGEKIESQSTIEVVDLVVGASNTPHAEILEAAAGILLEEDINIEIVVFDDYILPNKALANMELDANYFQHNIYLNVQNDRYDYDFVNAGGIHIEPIGVYSKTYTSIDELPDGAEIIISGSITEQGRMLATLQDLNLISLRADAGIYATVDDITENPRNIIIDNSLESALLAEAYLNGEGDAVLIPPNLALEAGLNPMEDAMILEKGDVSNPYVHIIAVRAKDETRPEIQTLVEVLNSSAIREFILETWQGGVVPAE
nr:MetQ/NlpA family ABC transporter substrate-binding protein [Halalkalibacter alkaliphilus]